MRKRSNAVLLISTGCFILAGAMAYNLQAKELAATQRQLFEANNLTQEVLYDIEEADHWLSLANEVIDTQQEMLDLLQDTHELRSPTVSIYDIPLSAEMQQYIYMTCAKYGIVDNYELILAMIWNESSFKADTISVTNDYGLMQINVCNHDWLRETLGTTDFLDPKQNVEAGIYMMSKVIKKYGNVDKALIAYNRGEVSAETLWNKGIRTNNYTRVTQEKLAKIQSDSYTK